MQRSLKTIVLLFITLITCTTIVPAGRGGFGQRADVNRTKQKPDIFGLIEINPEMAKQTINHDCSVLQQKNEDGQTPLSVAAAAGNEDLVTAMLKQPANIIKKIIDMKDKKGKTALCRVVDLSSTAKNGNSEKYSNIMQSLINAGADTTLCTQGEQKVVGTVVNKKKKQD